MCNYLFGVTKKKEKNKKNVCVCWLRVEVLIFSIYFLGWRRKEVNLHDIWREKWIYEQPFTTACVSSRPAKSQKKRNKLFHSKIDRFGRLFEIMFSHKQSILPFFWMIFLLFFSFTINKLSGFLFSCLVFLSDQSVSLSIFVSVSISVSVLSPSLSFSLSLYPAN